MTKKHFKLLFAVILAATLTLVMSGCGRGGQDLEGKNIVTFELLGGTLETKTTSVGTNINYAYHPGTKILDPTTLPNYKIYRSGYDFTGWYTSEECNPEDLWDFTLIIPGLIEGSPCKPSGSPGGLCGAAK